jgi:hypothetical protein
MIIWLIFYLALVVSYSLELTEKIIVTDKNEGNYVAMMVVNRLFSLITEGPLLTL